MEQQASSLIVAPAFIHIHLQNMLKGTCSQVVVFQHNSCMHTLSGHTSRAEQSVMSRLAVLLQYFEDDDLEEIEPNTVRSRDQRVAEEMVPTKSTRSGSNRDQSRNNGSINGSLATEQCCRAKRNDYIKRVADFRYPKLDRRAPDFYGGFHYW